MDYQSNFQDFNPETGLIIKDIGTVKNKSSVPISFFKTPIAGTNPPEYRTVQRFQPECGCTAVNDAGDRVDIQYHPNLGDGFEGEARATNKGVIAVFTDGFSERLVFSGVVVK